MAIENEADKSRDIGLNRPEEGLDVSGPGRFYPREYSGQIAAIEQKKGYTSKLPEALAGIVENMNDYRISLYQDQESVNIAEQGLRNKVFLDLRETKMQRDNINNVVEHDILTRSKIKQAEQEADIQGVDREPLVLEQLQEMANLPEEINTPYAASIWQQSFQAIGKDALGRAQDEDIKTSYIKQKANIEYLASTIRSDAFSGVSPEDCQANFWQRTAKYQKLLPAQDYLDIGIQNWNDVNLEYAYYLLEQAKLNLTDSTQGISLEQANTGIKNILQNSAKEFAYYDKDGKPALDAEGNPILNQVALTAPTQEKLKTILRSLGNAKGTKTGVSANTYIANLEKWLGYKDMSEKGSSKEWMGKGQREIADRFNTAVDGIIASGDTPEKQNEAFTKLLTMESRVNLLTGLRDMVLKNPQGCGPLIKSLSTKLNKDLRETGNANTDWDKYVLSVSDGQDGEIAIGASINAWKIPQGIDGKVTNQIYWEEMGKTLEEFANLADSSDLSSIYYRLDPEYQAGQEAIAGIAKDQNIIKFSGEYTDVSDTGVDAIEQSLDAFSKYCNGKGITNKLSDEFFDQLSKNINNPDNGFTDNRKKQVALDSYARALVSKGRGGDALSYYLRHSNGEDAQNTFATALAKSVFMSENEDLRQKVLDLNSGVYASDQTKAAEIKTLDALTTEKDLNAAITKELVNQRIPQKYRAVLTSLGTDICAVYHQEGNKIDNAIKKGLGGLLKSNFLEFSKGAKIQNNEKIYKHNPALSGWVSAEHLDSALTKTNSALNQLLPDRNISWACNDESGTVDMLVNNKLVTWKAKGAELERPAVTMFNPKDLGIASDPDLCYEKIPEWTALYASVNMLTNEGAAKQFLNRKIYDYSKPEVYTSGSWREGSNYIDTNTLLKEGFALESVMSDPVAMKKIAQTEKHARTMGAGGRFRNGVIQNAGDAPGISSGSRKIVEQLFSTDEYRRAPISRGTLDALYSYRNYGNMSEEGTPTGLAAAISPDTLTEVSARSAYAGKINQADVSVPLSLAAMGETDYIDMYNTAAVQGYNVTNAHIPGVTLPEEEGVPTGFASAMFTGSLDQAPTYRKGYQYSKDEMTAAINHYAKERGVDPAIIHAIAKQESGYQQNVRSKAGAVGVMQLMPKTAKSLGVTNPDDAYQNIWGGIKYFAQLKDMFQDDALAIAAYNAGPGAVGKYKGVPNYPETKRYVKNVLAMAGKTDSNTYPVTFAIQGNEKKFMDFDTGLLSPKKVNDFVYDVIHGKGYGDNVKQIVTSRPELLENKEEYSAFAKYRNMKTADGKPLFVKGNYNGFKVMVKRNTEHANGAANSALAADAVKTQSRHLPQTTADQIEALLNAFTGYDGKNTNRSDAFGRAHLEKSEYNSYGVPDEMIKNPVLQTRVLCQEFQKATDLLGSERKAVYALAGGTLRNEEGETKTWAEVKADKEAFTKTWFIKPNEDKAARDRANSILVSYENEYHTIRGY